MATFTLDDLRAAAEAKYGNTTIQFGEDEIVLVNALQLPKAKRDELIKEQDRFNPEDENEDVDQEEILASILRLVAKDAKKVDALLDVIGDNLAVLMEIFSAYSGGTQLGEASASDA